MNKLRASIFILTKNSGPTIRRALESVKDFEDIVICDGGSSDNTLDVARGYGANIFRQSENCLRGGLIKDFSCARNECFTKTKFDWVMYLDSDEMASKKLVEEVRGIVESNNMNFFIYRMPCQIFVGNKLIKHSSNYPGWQIRFFNKNSGAKFVKPVHEKLDFDKSRLMVGILHGPWHYFFLPDGSDMKADLPKYAAMEIARFCGQPFIKRARASFLSLRTAVKIFIKSLKNYLLHGFEDTMPPRFEFLRIRYQLMLGVYILLPRNKDSGQ